MASPDDGAKTENASRTTADVRQQNTRFGTRMKHWERHNLFRVSEAWRVSRFQFGEVLQKWDTDQLLVASLAPISGRGYSPLRQCVLTLAPKYGSCQSAHSVCLTRKRKKWNVPLIGLQLFSRLGYQTARTHTGDNNGFWGNFSLSC